MNLFSFSRSYFLVKEKRLCLRCRWVIFCSFRFLFLKVIFLPHSLLSPSPYPFLSATLSKDFIFSGQRSFLSLKQLISQTFVPERPALFSFTYTWIPNQILSVHITSCIFLALLLPPIFLCALSATLSHSSPLSFVTQLIQPFVWKFSLVKIMLLIAVLFMIKFSLNVIFLAIRLYFVACQVTPPFSWVSSTCH